MFGLIFLMLGSLAKSAENSLLFVVG